MLILSSLKLADSEVVEAHNTLQLQYFTGNILHLQTVEKFVIIDSITEFRIQKGDSVIASFFNKNSISFNVANSSSFGRMINERVEFAAQNPLQI